MKCFIKNLKCFNQWLLHIVIGRYAFRSKDYPVYLYNLYGSEGHSPDRRAVHKMIESGGFWDASWKICFDAINKSACPLCNGTGRRVFPNCTPPIDEPCPACKERN